MPLDPDEQRPARMPRVPLKKSPAAKAKAREPVIKLPGQPQPAKVDKMPSLPEDGDDEAPHPDAASSNSRPTPKPFTAGFNGTASDDILPVSKSSSLTDCKCLSDRQWERRHKVTKETENSPEKEELPTRKCSLLTIHRLPNMRHISLHISGRRFSSLVNQASAKALCSIKDLKAG